MNHIPMKITTVVEGRTWHLFSVTFDTPDGQYSTYISALSPQHAEMMLTDLKANGRVTGQIVGVVRK